MHAMALSIRSRSVEEKARKLAALRSTSITAALEQALDRELCNAMGEKERRKLDFVARVRGIQERVAKLPRLNGHLTDDELIGYDDNGLPC